MELMINLDHERGHYKLSALIDALIGSQELNLSENNLLNKIYFDSPIIR